MKKILCYLLTGVMAAGVLAGCGQKAQTGTENTAPEEKEAVQTEASSQPEAPVQQEAPVQRSRVRRLPSPHGMIMMKR